MIGVFAILMVMVVGGLVVGSVFLRLLFGLILLPFRLIGLVLFIPFMILRGILGAVFGLAMIPVTLVGLPLLIVGGIAATVLFSLLTPLLPLLVIAAVIWLLINAFARPRLI
jgi:hypothetical protein